MKLKKIMAAASAIAASLAFSTAASAYLAVPEEKADLLNTTADNWKLTIRSSYEVDYSGVETMRAVLEVTDPEAYAADKGNGFYSDGETAFTDFIGALSFGGADWLQFDFSGLEETDGGSGSVEIRVLGDGSYLMTAYFDGAAEPSPLLTSLSIAEWGNRSPDYTLRLTSIGLYGAELEPVIVFGGNGEQIDPPEIALPGASEEEPEETAEPEEEQPEETTTAAAETQPEETDAPAETTESAEEAAPAEPAQTQSAPPAQAINSDGFASRDSSLMIVMIAAGVFVVGAIIGIIIISMKKQK